MSGRRGLMALLLGALLAWAALPVAWPAWSEASTERNGKDFASYYYAARVALAGDDPWSKAALNAVSRADGTRRGVHPFLYPPPFVLVTSWIGRFPLASAYRIWFWLDVLLSVGAAAMLWASMRRVSPLAAPAIVLGFGALSALPNNHLMGQGNLLPLLFLVAGWWAEEEDRPFLAGALVGVAAMLKMSPALFVFLWLFQRNYRAIAGALTAAVALSLATLPLIGPATQLRFYTEILPTFASGGYNGLSVPIDLFGNHSLPNLLNQAFPGDAAGLSTAGRVLSTALAVALLGSLGWRHRLSSSDPLDRALTRGAVAVLGLLIPVYTYEHHLVFAVPALVGVLLAAERGRLAVATAAAVGVAAAVLWYDLDVLKEMHGMWRGRLLGDLLGEAKSIALIALFLAAGWLGRVRP